MKKAGQKIAVVNLKSMSVKLCFMIIHLLLLTTMGGAAPSPSYGQQPPPPGGRPALSGENVTDALRQLKNAVSDLKYELRNHEAEIHLFDNKLQSQETSFEHLRQQLLDEAQTQRDFTKASLVNLEGKTETLNQSLVNLDTLMKGLTNDLRQLKTQSNDSVAVLSQYKQKITELETFLQTQSQHMQNLEVALQSMMDVWQAKEAAREIANKPAIVETSSIDSDRNYKVQPGDSLGKIAQTQKVSIQALREANQLTSDRIRIGQTLKIP